MRQFVRAALLVGVLMLIAVSCQETRITADNTTAVLDELESKLDWLDHRTSLERWQLYTTGETDSLSFFDELYNYVISDNESFRVLQQADKLLKDDKERRRCDLLFDALMIGRVEGKPSVVRLRDSLATVDITYRAEFEGEERTAPDLYRIYRNDLSTTRRERAYRAWVSVGERLADGLERLIRLRNQQVRKLGYNNYPAMVFKLQGLKPVDYTTLLDRLDSLSVGPYMDIVDDIKNRLGKDYLELWDLHYAFSDVDLQVDRHFAVDTQLVLIKSALEGIGFDIDKLPIYLDLTSRPGKSQLAYAFAIKAPYDVRVLANQTDGLYSATVLTHELGHAIHSTQLQQEQPLFNTHISGIWHEAVAQIVAALMTEEDFLTTHAGVPPELAASYLANKRKQDIIYLRTTLMRLQFEYQAYINPTGDLNRMYWDLFERYMMLPRHDDLKPWAALIYYTTHPLYLQNYLYADMVAAQTVAHLRRNYSTIVDNPKTGAFLVQNYMRFGSRYDWRELLERGTDEKLNPDYFIERLAL
ncbi:MAG: hypothetical protein KAT79_03530 [candidate division Zixibacteria bacterium]|nr:hypothetical protein [candidate division Zixibacteria bacterium]